MQIHLDVYNLAWLVAFSNRLNIEYCRIDMVCLIHYWILDRYNFYTENLQKPAGYAMQETAPKTLHLHNAINMVAIKMRLVPFIHGKTTTCLSQIELCQGQLYTQTSLFRSRHIPDTVGASKAIQNDQGTYPIPATGAGRLLTNIACPVHCIFPGSAFLEGNFLCNSSFMQCIRECMKIFIFHHAPCFPSCIKNPPGYPEHPPGSRIF